jgi:uncharacterized protein (TIGR03083 family)
MVESSAMVEPRSPAVVVVELLEAAVALIRTPAVRAAWHQPSQLGSYDVRGLAGHLGRSVVVTARALDEPPATGGTRVDAPGYFVTALGDADPVDSDLHRAVRERSAELAGDSPDALAATLEQGLADLAPRLLAADLDREVPALGGLVLTLRDQLATRIVELSVHLDDLAESVGVPVTLPDDAGRVATAVLAEVMRRRHGDIAALRVLARRERADPAVRAV